MRFASGAQVFEVSKLRDEPSVSISIFPTHIFAFRLSRAYILIADVLVRDSQESGMRQDNPTGCDRLVAKPRALNGICWTNSNR
jgi:hypothetical protein